MEKEEWEEANESQDRQVLIPAPPEEEPQAPAQAGGDLLETSSAEKNLGVLVENKLAMCQQCVLGAKKASGILGWIRKRVCIPGLQIKGGDPVPLLSPGEAHLECCVQFWAPPDKGHMEVLERVQRRTMKTYLLEQHILPEKRISFLLYAKTCTDLTLQVALEAEEGCEGHETQFLPFLILTSSETSLQKGGPAGFGSTLISLCLTQPPACSYTSNPGRTKTSSCDE
ncbi:hypothetical protein HGM15179_012458 [Zosterops borbonicus]|uniref:Uncharacterized protein n=1 Tax=Zosterops borbonicus TaxID=364589 RepID=A0A8K1LHV6_9PASS|nr:hypothetical protein HGM15179_012458 [Zosterops borbonicus]